MKNLDVIKKDKINKATMTATYKNLSVVISCDMSGNITYLNPVTQEENNSYEQAVLEWRTQSEETNCECNELDEILKKDNTLSQKIWDNNGEEYTYNVIEDVKKYDNIYDLLDDIYGDDTFNDLDEIVAELEVGLSENSTGCVDFESKGKKITIRQEYSESYALMDENKEAYDRWLESMFFYIA